MTTETDLASEVVGGVVAAANDDFFAPKENLLKVAPPEHRPGVYTDRGKWMDGWETRRRREPGHDWALIRLGIQGRVGTVEVDTAHFTGNFPESCEVWATGAGDVGEDRLLADPSLWEELVPRSRLEGDHRNVFTVDGGHRATHLKLVIHPDGGVARLRVLGEPIPDRSDVAGAGDPFAAPRGPVDVSALQVGGAIVTCSDDFFSNPRHLLLPTEPVGMFDGWETKRRRGPGNDWVVLRLGMPAVVERIVVDTSFFKGNAPGWVSVAGCRSDRDLPADDEWSELVAKTAVEPDALNELTSSSQATVSHIRLDIHPDGGVARLRVLGSPEAAAQQQWRLRYLGALQERAATSFFLTACGSRAWVEAMKAGRPYMSGDEVLAAAEGAFRRLSEDDWLEAFAAHPRIGRSAGGQTAAGEAMSHSEQSRVGQAAVGVLERMADLNEEYERRFGFRYIVSAAGRSGPELLDLLERRLSNDRSEEIGNASQEQQAISRRRLRWLLCMEEEA